MEVDRSNFFCLIIMITIVITAALYLIAFKENSPDLKPIQAGIKIN
jgi:hypothetical protein